MSDDKNIPLYLMAVPQAGVAMKDKSGRSIRVHAWPLEGADTDLIKRLFPAGHGRELSDENAEILHRGGRVRLVPEA